MVDKQSVGNSDQPTGKGRPTPSRKEAEAARKKQMKQPMTRKEQRAKENEARRLMRAKTVEAMKTGDDRYLPARDKGPVRRFIRDYVDRRYNMAEFLVPLLLTILVLSVINTPWARFLYAVLSLFMIFGTVLDVFFLIRGLKKNLKARFEPEELRGSTSYGLLRSSQIRAFRQPKPQVKRREALRDRY